MSQQNFTAQRLRSVVERLKRLDIDRKAVADDIKGVMDEAKSVGFEVKIIKRMMRLLQQDKVQRASEQAILDLYMSAVEGFPPEGGDAPPPPEDEPGLPFDASLPPSTPGEDEPQGGAPQPYVPPTVDNRDVASGKGREAARAGVAITSNPYPPATPNRMAWDEAWCAETGTDGMDIPAALKPAADRLPVPEFGPDPEDRPEPRP